MASGFRARVLVVKGAEYSLNLLRELFESANFVVESVHSVSEVPSKVKSFDPREGFSALIMDQLVLRVQIC